MKCVEVERLKRARINAEQMQLVTAPTQEPVEGDISGTKWLHNSLRYPQTPDENRQPSDWRKMDPLYKKYGHLPALASFPVHTPIDGSGHAGEYMVPNHASTLMRGIHQVVVGHLFEVTEMSQPYFLPPGAYASDLHGKKIDIASFGDSPDRVFGVGVEFPMEMVRCAVMWDDTTHTYALMIGA